MGRGVAESLQLQARGPSGALCRLQRDSLRQPCSYTPPTSALTLCAHTYQLSSHKHLHLHSGTD